MALSSDNYGYLIDPMLAFTDEHGKTIADGFVRVFLAGTSTPAMTYSNFYGTPNPERIELDNSGRTAKSVIADKSALYKVCVYDAEHSQESPIVTKDYVAVGEGGGGGFGTVCAINNWTSSSKDNYYDIPISANNNCTFEIAFLPSSNFGGVCAFWSNNVVGTPIVAVNAFSAMIDIFDGDTSRYDMHTPQVGVINKVKLSRDKSLAGGGYRSEVTNTQTNVTTTEEMTWINRDNPINILRIFEGRVSADSARNCLIFFIKITSEGGDVIYNFVPDEQEGVAGFTETISGNFYGSPYVDNSIYAVKTIEP